MARSFDDLSDILTHGYDTLIDVRSPAEFAIDHIPGAINLPALDNEERAKVGTIYKQTSPFDGRKIGAALVLQNVANHIAGPLAEKDGSWRPLVYCWRGGQRSGVFATLLREIGWRADAVQGGYTNFRQLVHKRLYDQMTPHKIILLDGFTGTGKTDILHRLSARGAQIIDLEGLAHHRGSLLGAIPGGQPSQKAFETALAVALEQLDPARSVLIEAESNKIGRLIIPPRLWAAMLDAPRIAITASLDARAAYLADAYQDVISDADLMTRRLAPLRALRGHAAVDQWIALSKAFDLNALSMSLITQHYDPAYTKSRARHAAKPFATVHADSLDDDGLDATAGQIAALLADVDF